MFPSGLSILLAIFQELGIQSMTLAGGALREGLVYGMLHLPVEQDIRQRTLLNLQRRYLLDGEQGQRVSTLADNFLHQLAQDWPLDHRCRELLHSAGFLHEIGPAIDFRNAPQHAAYLIRNSDLPSFTPAQKKLLAILVLNQSGALDLQSLNQQNAVPVLPAQRLCRLLRLAIIFASRRRDDTLPDSILRADGDTLHIQLPAGWPPIPCAQKRWSRKAVGRAMPIGHW